MSDQLAQHVGCACLCDVDFGCTGADRKRLETSTVSHIRSWCPSWAVTWQAHVNDLLRCLTSWHSMWVVHVCAMLMLVAQGLTGRDLRRQPFLTFAVGVRAGLSHGKPT